MDAPGHFYEEGRHSPDITLGELIIPIVVLDISARAASDPDTTVTVDDLRRFERRHGRIPKGALVCMDSGWAAKFGDPAPRTLAITSPASARRPRCGWPSTATSRASAWTR